MHDLNPKRILLIRPSALGDVCRSVPVVTSLHKRWPEATIDWLVQKGFEDAISAHPNVDDTILFDREQMRSWYTPKGFFAILSFLRVLKAKKYDLVIDAQGLGRSGLFTWATRAQSRIGAKNAREFAWLGYNERVDIQSTHTVDCMLELAQFAGAEILPDMQLYVQQKDAEWWDEYRVDQLLHEKYMVLAPTSRWKSKQWPIEYFAKIAEVAKEKGIGVVVVGAPAEASQVETVTMHEGVLNLLPELTIGRLMAVVSRAAIVVANDSAALHMAVGFNRPIVALYGPTNPATVGPYLQESSVISASVSYDEVHYRSSSIGDSIMRTIEVDQVAKRVHEVLDS